MRRDISGFLVRLTDETIAAYEGSVQWPGRTLADHADALLREAPDRVLLVDGELRLTCRDLHDKARRLAHALHREGLRPGARIAYQLPNWHEAAVVNLAAAMGGYVVVPLVPIYREREVGFILKDAGCEVLFVPQTFRRFDYPQMISRIRPDLPGLKHVVVVRGSGGDAEFEPFLGEVPASHAFPRVDPNAVKLIIYTSGTTGRAKGVLHSHNTMMSDLLATIDFWKIDGGDCTFMPSPVTHITGYLYALELPFIAGSPAVLMQVWDADQAVRLVDEHRCTLAFGATPFLTEFLAAATAAGSRVPSLQIWPCGGTSVSPQLVRDSMHALPEATICRIYGASEAPTVTMGVPRRSRSAAIDLIAAETDGRICNNEVRIRDPHTGAVLPDGAEGEVLVRGPEILLGYTNPDDNAAAFDRDGFFRTGDLGRIDHGDCVTITGRWKDIIIRGGENISPKEIEDALLGHPAVHSCAVVAMPHQRLGEGVCAFVVPAAGADVPALPDISAFLQTAGLARQKIPERLEIVDALPATPSGKVRKDELRRRAAEFAPAATGRRP